MSAQIGVVRTGLGARSRLDCSGAMRSRSTLPERLSSSSHAGSYSLTRRRKNLGLRRCGRRLEAFPSCDTMLATASAPSTFASRCDALPLNKKRTKSRASTGSIFAQPIFTV